MNIERRREIAKIADRITELNDLRDQIKDDLETIRDEEQEYFDNMPESFQNADRGQLAQQAVNSLDEAIGLLDDIDTDSMGSALETAAE